MIFVVTWVAANSNALEVGHRDIAIEIKAIWAAKPLALSQDVETDDMKVKVTRIDYLLSHASLKRKDGSWLQTRDWFASFKHSAGRDTALIFGVPAEEFTAIRFAVGVDPETNRSDPHLRAPEHPLNPEVNGLHWGWQGGYIFMALEGHFTSKSGNDGAYSLHLANDPHLVWVEVPLKLPPAGVGTIHLTLDLEQAFHGKNKINLTQGENSTHSREGDPLAPKLAANLQNAFRLKTLSADQFQSPSKARALKNQLSSPYPLSISARFPKVQLPPDNFPTIDGVALGERLFHETNLSKTNKQSCASCHDSSAAFADPGKRFSTGAEGQIGFRNAMPLFNLLWEKEFFWDGRVSGLRNQVLKPVQDPHEMNETLERVIGKLNSKKGYAERFEKTFGDPKITAERISLALEQYLHSLISQDSKFDRAALNQTTLTPSEARGLQLFVTESDPKRGLKGADCFHCHGGMLFTDHEFHNNGLKLATHDIGRMTVTRSPADKGKFKTPSLRNIALTAPYMHDGRFETLQEVVEHYDHGVVHTDTLDPNLAKHPTQGLGLTSEDKADLVAFLRTLTDPKYNEQRPTLSQTAPKTEP